MAGPDNAVVVSLDEDSTEAEVLDLPQRTWPGVTELLIAPEAKARIRRYYADRGETDLERSAGYDDSMKLGGPDLVGELREALGLTGGIRQPGPAPELWPPGDANGSGP